MKAEVVNKHISIGVDLCCADGCGVVVDEGEGFEWINRAMGVRFIYCSFECGMNDLEQWKED